jgi:hypothetical protein
LGGIAKRAFREFIKKMLYLILAAERMQSENLKTAKLSYDTK